MIWRVEIYSYETVDKIIVCDLEATSKDKAIDAAVHKMRFNLLPSHLEKHHDIVNKAFNMYQNHDSDYESWFWVASEVEEIEYQIPQGITPYIPPCDHIALNFTVADAFSPAAFIETGIVGTVGTSGTSATTVFSVNSVTT